MLNKKILIYTLILSFSLSSLIAQEKVKLSLEKALALGKENSKVLNSSKAKITSANAKINEASAGSLPSVKFQGSYTRLSSVPEFQFPFTIPGVPNLSLFPILLNQTALQVNVTQPIFTGNKISGGKEAAEFLAKATEVDFTKDESDINFNVRNNYWNLKKAISFKKLTDENITQLNAHLNNIRKLEQNGMATNNDVLKLEVQLNEAMLRQIDAQNAIQLSNVALNNLLGFNLNTEVELESEPNASKENLADLNELVNEAYKTRPEISSTEYRLKATEKLIDITKGSYYPQVAVAGNVTYANPNQRFLPNRTEFDATWYLALQVSYDIWNWNTTKYQVEQAESQAVQVKDGLAQLKDGILMEVTQNYLSYSQLQKKLAINEFSVRQALENRRVTNEKLNAGTVLANDLIDAEVSLLQSQTNLLQTTIDIEIAKARLNKSLGK
jgi:outer membrane protein TolC